MGMKVLFCLLALSLSVVAESQPVEIGTVTWERDYDRALAKAKTSGKPVFLLFQEVPGCKGCVDFGREVLSNKTLVPLIESHFVPLVVYNNQGGSHAKIRKQYKEPAWNYQVIRFLDAEGRDLIPRKDRVWSIPALAGRMIDSLKQAKRPIPASLYPLAGHKVSGQTSATAAFAQYCFWTGERKLGALEGVMKTEAGFIGHREVTKVTYDPAVISYASLLKQARQMKCASKAYATLPASYRPAPKHDQKKQIQGTPFARLDLSPEQATKVNAHARSNPKKAAQYLNQEQRADLAEALR